MSNHVDRENKIEKQPRVPARVEELATQSAHFWWTHQMRLTHRVEQLEAALQDSGFRGRKGWNKLRYGVYGVPQGGGLFGAQAAASSGWEIILRSGKGGSYQFYADVVQRSSEEGEETPELRDRASRTRCFETVKAAVLEVAGQFHDVEIRLVACAGLERRLGELERLCPGEHLRFLRWGIAAVRAALNFNYPENLNIAQFGQIVTSVQMICELGPAVGRDSCRRIRRELLAAGFSLLPTMTCKAVELGEKSEG